MTPWTDIHQRAVRRGYSFDAAAAIADRWGRPIGEARPGEPGEALLLCAWGAACGTAERWGMGWLLDTAGLPRKRASVRRGGDG